MTFPSATLLAQSALSGVFIGSLYGLLGLGLGLTWGLLHVINLAHFAFAFLAAYLCYQLASVGGMDPLLTLAIIVPLFFSARRRVHWLLARFSVSPLNSLLLTFGLRGDHRSRHPVRSGRPISASSNPSTRGQNSASVTLFVPVPELMTLLLALALSFGDLGGDALHRSRPCAARARRGCAGRGGLRHQCAARTRSCLPACAARSRASPASASRWVSR